MNYYEKYLKYKTKYNNLKLLLGGGKLKVGDKARYKKSLIFGIITNIFNENGIEYVTMKDDLELKLHTYPLSEFTKINKFKIGDTVKRTRRTIPGSNSVALGLTGKIMSIDEEVPAYKTANNKLIVLMYDVQFDIPDLGKININLIEDDLDLVKPRPIPLYPIKASSREPESPFGSLSPYLKI